MSKVYKYKRVGARKVAVILSIATAIILLLLAITTPEVVISKPTLIVLSVFLCGILLYSTHKRNHVRIEDETLEIVNTKIPVLKMKKIELSEEKIDIFVEKGIFLLGTRLNITKTCFYSAQDWNDFKQDIENLKTKINQ